MSSFTVTTFYRFTPISREDLPKVRIQFLNDGKRLELNGLLLIATEGCNGTVAGSAENITLFKEMLTARFGEMAFKDSIADHRPFRRWKVSLREEIVALGKPEIIPPSLKNNHLSPREWEEMLKRDDVIVVDTRNTYETEIGIFKGAIDPRTEKFNEFPDFVEKADLPKEKTIMLYCTGGIRCEKATVEMQKRGYKNVYQLDGGILKYLEEMPGQSFEGECFVFDHRVSVDQHLQPSKQFSMCLHCGNPGNMRSTCEKCEKPSVACKGCLAKGKPQACSKNCCHHLSLSR